MGQRPVRRDGTAPCSDIFDVADCFAARPGDRAHERSCSYPGERCRHGSTPAVPRPTRGRLPQSPHRAHGARLRAVKGRFWHRRAELRRSNGGRLRPKDTPRCPRKICLDWSRYARDLPYSLLSHTPQANSFHRSPSRAPQTLTIRPAHRSSSRRRVTFQRKPSGKPERTALGARSSVAAHRGLRSARLVLRKPIDEGRSRAFSRQLSCL